jgi:hypothetical protein
VKRSSEKEEEAQQEVQTLEGVEQHHPVVRNSAGNGGPDDEDTSRYAEVFGILALGVVVILLLGITMLFIIDFGIDFDNTDLENNINPWGGSSFQNKKIIKMVVLIKKKFPVMLKNRLWSEEQTITVIV